MIVTLTVDRGYASGRSLDCDPVQCAGCSHRSGHVAIAVTVVAVAVTVVVAMALAIPVATLALAVADPVVEGGTDFWGDSKGRRTGWLPTRAQP